ncbi:MAG: hypothetical protein KDA93_18560 [Planctomycetaceae bacterium]|nr:hypothetical protein [Planctomycetaceae bacterium]
MNKSFGADVLARVTDFKNAKSYRWMVRMTLSFSHRQVAEDLAERLSDDCLTCEVIGDEYDDEWLCRVERSYVEDEILLSAWADRIQELTTLAGGEVEDWECGIHLGDFCPADLLEQLSEKSPCFA